MKMVTGTRWTVTILLLLGIVVTMAGCGGSSALVGEWRETSGNGGITFYADGSGLFMGYQCKWKTEKNQIILSGLSDYKTVDYRISGSTLTITPPPPAYQRIFTKVKK